MTEMRSPAFGPGHPAPLHRALSTAARLCLVVAACLVSPCVLGADTVGPPTAMQSVGHAFRVNRVDGTSLEGDLLSITAAELVIDAVRLPLDAVRVVERMPAAAAANDPAEEARDAVKKVRLECRDGSTLSGDDFLWSDGTATLVRRDGPVSLPAERLKRVVWRSDADADWTRSLPESVDGDLVVVAKGEGFEFVECAITAVTAEAVTVVLDDETIPVKRTKVLGLQWLRENAESESPPAMVVDVVGGRLLAESLVWSPEALFVDDCVRLPAAMLSRIDFTTGRVVSLATLPPERVEVEPFFGGLARIDGLASYFAPRPVAADDHFAQPGFLVRPRTVAVWRIPRGARQLRTACVSAMAGRGGGTVVAIAVDEREVFRQPIDSAKPMPIEIDLRDARRLTLTVDFGTAADGPAVRFENPVIEK